MAFKTETNEVYRLVMFPVLINVVNVDRPLVVARRADNACAIVSLPDFGARWTIAVENGLSALLWAWNALACFIPRIAFNVCLAMFAAQERPRLSRATTFNAKAVVFVLLAPLLNTLTLLLKASRTHGFAQRGWRDATDAATFRFPMNVVDGVLVNTHPSSHFVGIARLFKKLKDAVAVNSGVEGHRLLPVSVGDPADAYHNMYISATANRPLK